MMLIPMWVLALLSIWIGLNAYWMDYAADGAARVLLTGVGG